MNDRVRSGDRLVQLAFLKYRALDELNAHVLQIRSTTGGQIVDHRDRCDLRTIEERATQVCPDEPCAACNNNPGHSHSTFGTAGQARRVSRMCTDSVATSA